MTYNPHTTTHHEAAALCGLTLNPHCTAATNPARFCELRDATGTAVFAGERWPDSWLYMEQHCGLVAEPALPDDWYGKKVEVTE